MTPIKMLIVDDDSVFVFIIKKTISKTSFQPEIEVFGDGEVSINHIKNIKDKPELLPDIILLDINMPVLDGWGFLEEFIKIAPTLAKKVQIYLVTSSISPHDFEKAKSYSLLSDFVIKPVDREKVSELLENLYN